MPRGNSGHHDVQPHPRGHAEHWAPHNPATVVREVDAVARLAPTEHEFAVTTAAWRKVFGLATADVRLA